MVSHLLHASANSLAEDRLEWYIVHTNDRHARPFAIDGRCDLHSDEARSDHDDLLALGFLLGSQR